MAAVRRKQRVPFAWRLIAHRKRRTAVAAAGIAFAILVVFLQLGFYSAVVNTAVAVTSQFDADLILISPRFVHLTETSQVPRVRLFQAMAVPEVETAIPLYFRYARWRDIDTGQTCKLFAIGFPLAEGVPLRTEGVAGQLRALKPSKTFLVDRLTQEKCGPVNGDGNVEIREQSARIVGDFEMGVGFLADGAMVLSDDSFSALFGNYPLDRPHLGLIRLVDGADPDAAAAALQAILPVDTRVVTLEGLSSLQIRHWVESTAVGNIFGMGAITGFFVGLVVLYQILSADIRMHLPLYATLKAMGYRDRRLYRFVLEQAWIFASLGFLPAFVMTAVGFPVIHALTKLPIFVTPWLTGLVLFLSFAMCTGAALLSLRRISVADPAELF